MDTLFKTIVFRGWIFIGLFILVNWILLAKFPEHFSKRFFSSDDFSINFNSRREILNSNIYGKLLNITMLYTLFLPLSSNSLHFYTGITIILSSLVLYIITLINYASTPPEQPVTKGIYKISRHPQQVLTEFLLIGCGIAADSYLIILSCIIQAVLLYHSMKVQERNCIERYGKPYEDYIKKTPRFFIVF